NALFLVDRGLERSKVNDLLARRVRDALVGQGEHAENDESDTDESHEFHNAQLPLLVMLFSGAGSFRRRGFGGREIRALENRGGHRPPAENGAELLPVRDRTVLGPKPDDRSDLGLADADQLKQLASIGQVDPDLICQVDLLRTPIERKDASCATTLVC